MLLAEPTVSLPSSSLSRFSSVVPVTSDGSSPLAPTPSPPTSSPTVISNSSGPCGSDELSARAIIAATPIPLSAPSVVPSAVSQSPSRTQLDPALGRIVGAVRPALTHHVQVSLEDDGRSRLAPGARRYAHDQVAGRVLPRGRTRWRPPRSDVLDDRLLVERRTRNPGQRLEVSPARLGLEAPQRGARRRSSVSRRPHHDDLRAVGADVVTAVMLRTARVGDQADQAQHGEDQDQHRGHCGRSDVMTPPPRLRGRRRTGRSVRRAAATPSADTCRRGHGRSRGHPSRRPRSG